MSDKRGSNANHAISGGLVWFIGWLFTIGYADLSFFKGLIGLLLWPFYLGDTFQ